MMGERNAGLEELLRPECIVKLSVRRGGLSVSFGTRDFRDLSDGQFPVELWKCCEMEGGAVEAEHRGTVKLERRLPAGLARVGRGWRHGAKAQWIEIRTPKKRLKEPPGNRGVA